jgi:hypothetical protein
MTTDKQQTYSHSSLPWQCHIPNSCLPYITSKTGKLTVANTINGATPEEADANAQFIVTAVNSHAALVEALENIVSEWGRQKRLFPILAKDGWMEECMAKANAVLAKGGE